MILKISNDNVVLNKCTYLMRFFAILILFDIFVNKSVTDEKLLSRLLSIFIFDVWHSTSPKNRLTRANEFAMTYLKKSTSKKKIKLLLRSL